MFWEKIGELVRAGQSANIACDMVYQVYGVRASVTDVLHKMYKDRKSGEWPDSLRVLRY